MQNDLNAILQQIIAWLRARQEPVWLVGGTVRDGLLGRPAHDIDLVVPEGGLRLALALADALGAAYFPLDSARDVGRAVLRLADGSSVAIDVACLRSPTLHDDLFARDFSINAMAWDVHDPDLTPIDPVGGRADLAAGRLRMASARSFADDPLRIVRGVRFVNQLGLTWQPATLAKARLAVADLVTIAGERVREELVRILSAASASQGLRQLDDLGALAVLLPEVKALQGVTQNPPHPLDVYDHTLAAVDWLHHLLGYLATEFEAKASGNPTIEADRDGPADVRTGFDVALAPYVADLARYLAKSAEQGYARRDLLPWAALLHDIGKPATRRTLADGTIDFDGHAMAGSGLARAILQRLRFSREAVQRVARICATHDRPRALAHASDGTPDRRAIYRYFQATRPVGVETALLSLADHLAVWSPHVRSDRWSRRVRLVSHLLEAYFRHHDQQVAPKPLLDGTTLMATLQLKSGPTVGAYLAALQEEQAAGTVTTTAEAWAFVRTFAPHPPKR